MADGTLNGFSTRDYMTAAEAASLLGTTARSVARYAARGRLERVRDTVDQTWRYKRASVEALKAESESEPLDPPEEDYLMAQAYRLIDALNTPARLYGEALERLIQKGEQRIEVLEKQLDEAIKAREVYLSEATERQVLIDNAAQSNKRRNMALEKVATWVPQYLKALGAKDSAAKLLSTLDVDQVTLLLNTDLIRDEQKQLLRGLLDENKLRSADAVATTGTEEKGDQSCQSDKPE